MAGYLKIGDIKGESQDKDHKEWIDIMSISQTVVRPVNMGSARDSGSVQVGELAIAKACDKSSPKLMEAVCKGTSFKEVQIDICASIGENNRVPVYQWKLKNARVSSYSYGGSSDSSSMTESLSLVFEEIEWTYDQIDKEGKSKGKVDASWKVEEGTK